MTAKQFAHHGASSGLSANSPSTAPPAALPRTNSPSKPKNAKIVVFSARWANFFAHRAQRHGDVETNDTSAATDVGHRETPITTARPSTATVETDNTSATKKRTKNTHFSPAKAMSVSTPHGNERAKVPPVSDNRAARGYKPAPQKTRMQFDWVTFQ